jgi:hypothetical protein
MGYESHNTSGSESAFSCHGSGSVKGRVLAKSTKREILGLQHFRVHPPRDAHGQE